MSQKISGILILSILKTTHYAKGNKPVRERQIPYDFTHMWNLMNKLN